MSINKLFTGSLYCILINALLLTSSFHLKAQSRQGYFTDSILIAKNFPLLSLIKQNKEINSSIEKDSVFQRIEIAQHERIEQALESCGTVSCYADSLS